MRVLMFGWEFPPFNSGGLGVACEGLTRALHRRKVELIFVLPKKYDIALDFIRFASDGTEDQSSSIAVNSLLTPYLDSASYGARQGEGPAGMYGENIFIEVERYGAWARVLARREQFDIIHAHDWLSFPAGLAAKEASGKPLIVHVHATEYDRTGGNRPNQTIIDIERRGFEAADLVIAVSGFVRDTLISKYGVSPDKIFVCHNGIDPREPFAQALPALRRAGRKIVLFVGRLTIQKGPDYFLQAAPIVLAHEPKALFVIAGKGDLERQLILESARLGLRERVIFAGFLRGRDLDRLYHMAHVFVMPSVAEPFGLAALEAAQAGVPIILSKQSGVKEIIKHALLVDFWDVRALADKIIAVLRYPALGGVLRKMAEGEIRKNTWDHTARAVVETYSMLQ